MRPIVNMPKEDRATDMGSMHTKKLVKNAHVVPEISSWTDRQTDRHRQTYSSQYFATAPAGELTTKSPGLVASHDLRPENGPRHKLLRPGQCREMERTAAESVGDRLSRVAERLEVRTEKQSSRSPIVAADRRLSATDRAQLVDGPRVSGHLAVDTDHHQLHAGLPAALRLQPRTDQVVRPVTRNGSNQSPSIY